MEKTKIAYLWKDRKRFLGMPLSFTRYMLSEDRLFLSKGFLNVKDEELLLYRIRDISTIRSLFFLIFQTTFPHHRRKELLGIVNTINSDKDILSFVTAKTHFTNFKCVRNGEIITLHKTIDFNVTSCSRESVTFDSFTIGGSSSGFNYHTSHNCFCDYLYIVEVFKIIKIIRELRYHD